MADGAYARSSVFVAGHRWMPALLFNQGLSVDIRVPVEVAEALAAGQPTSRLMRGLGFGRLRADGSTPLTPDPGRVWIQSALGDATLVWRPEGFAEPLAFFELGRLFGAADNTWKYLETVQRIQTLVVMGDEPGAWGGLVYITADGSENHPTA